MSELYSSVTPRIYDSASAFAKYIVEKHGVETDRLWKYMGRYIRRARIEYRKRFVDWFAPHHVEQAQHELAEAIVADLWG